MKARVFLAIILGIGILVFIAWLTGQRVKEMGLAVPTPFSASPKDATDSDLPILSRNMPEFAGIEAWLNSGPLKQEELRGKVVLVDFWTYSCINCIRTLPHVTSWHEKYKATDFTVIGVHTPEFAFEKEEGNVRKAIERHGITYPVALDNSYATWNAYANRYWPAHYLFDAEGRLRYVHFGEGRYDETERHIQELLREAGRATESEVASGGLEVEFEKIGTRETYLGHARMDLLGSPETVLRDQETVFSAPEDPPEGRFYFSGAWKVEAERAVAGADARILYRFTAANANLVIAPPEGKSARIEVLLDGAPVPDGYRGADVKLAADGRTYATVDEETLYDLIDAPGKYEQHLLEIRFLDPGTAGYAFTFG